MTIKKKTALWSGLCQIVNAQAEETYTIYGYAKTEPGSTFNIAYHSGTPTSGSAVVGNLVTYRDGVLQSSSAGRVSDDEFLWFALQFKIIQSGIIRPGFEMATAGTMYVCGLKLVRGEYDPDIKWTPAPSDWLADPGNYTWTAL